MRSLLLVLDSVGIGGAPDADAHGDRGADTLGHVFAQSPDLALPALFSLGLGEVLAGHVDAGKAASVPGCYGRMRELSPGKDSVTGHWEIAGAPLKQPFATFERLPPLLLEAIEAEAKTRFLGNGPGEGAAMLATHGAEHCASGHPILYTSPDFALRIAAHEGIIPARRLHEIGRVARRHCNAYRIARITTHPFSGAAGSFAFSPGVGEFPIVPPRTVFNPISEAGHLVHGVGKINRVFAGSGITHAHAAASNTEALACVEELWAGLHEGLLVANLAEFDTPHGHERDVAGYARTLAAFDAWLAGFLPHVKGDDLLIITSDHGNDPTFRGNQHTREEVPLLVKHARHAMPLGTRDTFADVAATLAAFFHLGERWPVGTPFLQFTPPSSRHFKPRR